MPAPSTSKVTIDDARNILCIRGTSSIDSSRSMWLDSSPREYKLYCSESYLSWLVKTDPRHMGLLQHVLNELKHVITTNDLASKELIGNFLINPEFQPPTKDTFKESTHFVRLVLAPVENDGRRSMRSSSIVTPEALEYVFSWDAFQSTDKIVADIKLMKLLSNSKDEGKDWTNLVSERCEVQYCHTPQCDRMFLLNHGGPLRPDKARKARFRPGLERLKSSLSRST